MIKHIYSVLLYVALGSLLACHPTYTRVKGTLPDFASLEKVEEGKFPRISAHRGGRNLHGYPENALETFQYLLTQEQAMLECDVRLTADSTLILMHDNTLNRTTTCEGPLDQYTWADMQRCKLVDDYGQETPFGIPTLSEVLAWARGKAIMSLDVKRGVPFDAVIAEVNAQRASQYAAIITYNLEDAQTVHRLDPNLLISCSIRSIDEFNRFKEADIPWENMIAFTGTRMPDQAVLDSLHQHDVLCMLGTLGNLDQKAAANGERLYQALDVMGVDVFATDRPLVVDSILHR